MGAKTSRSERDVQAREVVDFLKGEGYDTDWYDGPFNSQGEKWNRIGNAFATVADKSMKSAFINEDMEAMNRYANRLGLKINKTDAGSNVFRTKDMDSAITARKATAAERSRVTNTLVQEGMPYEEAKVEALRLLSQDKNYKKLEKQANKNGYPASAFQAAMDLEAE